MHPLSNDLVPTTRVPWLLIASFAVVAGLSAVSPRMALAVWLALAVGAAACYTFRPTNPLFAAAALAAVVEVVSGTLPGATLAPQWRMAAVAACVAPSVLCVATLDGMHPPRRRHVPRSNTGFVVIIAAIPFGAVTAALEGLQHTPARWIDLFGMGAAVSFTAFVEEACFRRVVHVAARARCGAAAPFISAGIWAATAAASRDVVHVVLIACLGLAYAYVYDKTARWWHIVCSHALLNLIVFVVVPAW